MTHPQIELARRNLWQAGAFDQWTASGLRVSFLFLEYLLQNEPVTGPFHDCEVPASAGV
jgi:hypothetical protein